MEPQRTVHPALRRIGPFVLAASLVATVAVPVAVRAGGPFDDAMSAAMTRMDLAMAHAPMTGDSDRDFVAMMLPHHAGAIAMATLELAHGHDPRLLRLAQEIVVTQDSETQVMRAIARDLASKRKPSR
jgi:uncharacterized protein (DUF305 family)